MYILVCYKIISGIDLLLNSHSYLKTNIYELHFFGRLSPSDARQYILIGDKDSSCSVTFCAGCIGSLSELQLVCETLL